MEDVNKARQQETPQKTYTIGSRKLDYIFMSPHLLGMVRRSGYLAINKGVVSDHRMIYIDFNLATFLGGNVNQILWLYNFFIFK